MAQVHDMSAPKMTRVTVRVPKSTLDQINDWVDALGVRRSHFLGIALVAGVRALMQASALEMPLASRRSAQPDAEPAAQEPVEDGGTLPGAAGLDALTQMVQTLEAEVARLKSEIHDLGEQVQAQRAPSGKRS
jgi:TolA-binding protein